MPAYPMICPACGPFTHRQSIHEPLPADCPRCAAPGVAQDYAAKDVIARDGVIRTVGQQAEKNLKEMGKEQERMVAEEMLGPHGLEKRNAPTPWWREPGSKPLKLDSVRDVDKFIMTGEKD